MLSAEIFASACVSAVASLISNSRPLTPRRAVALVHHDTAEGALWIVTAEEARGPIVAGDVDGLIRRHVYAGVARVVGSIRLFVDLRRVRPKGPLKCRELDEELPFDENTSGTLRRLQAAYPLACSRPWPGGRSSDLASITAPATGCVAGATRTRRT